jgi:hypothetical protein
MLFPSSSPALGDEDVGVRCSPVVDEVGKNQLSMLAWQTYRNAQTEAVFAPKRVDNADPGPPLQHTG